MINNHGRMRISNSVQFRYILEAELCCKGLIMSKEWKRGLQWLSTLGPATSVLRSGNKYISRGEKAQTTDFRRRIRLSNFCNAHKKIPPLHVKGRFFANTVNKTKVYSEVENVQKCSTTSKCRKLQKVSECFFDCVVGLLFWGQVKQNAAATPRLECSSFSQSFSRCSSLWSFGW